ncbi:MAG: PAS domain S-box protein [Ignavibacterium sp.]|nr:MAG: PAS domain S-box protein [Ignavibacterium sp.]
MIEIIENTFRILARVTNSKTAMLLSINNFETSVISFVGENPDKFNEFKKALLHLHKRSSIDVRNVQTFPEYKTIARELSVKSCFIQNVYSIIEQNEAFYIVLFYDAENNHLLPTDESFMAILNILSNQIKQYYSNKYKKSSPLPVADDNFDSDSIIENWENNFTRLLSISDDLIFILDKDGCFLKINDSGVHLLDYKEKEILGKHFIEFIPPERNAEVAGAIVKMLQSNDEVKFKTELRTKVNRNIPIEIRGKAITKNGSVIGMLGIGKDVTQLSRTEKEIKKLQPKLVEANRLISVERARTWQQGSLIEELERLKSEFVSNISHEFRTPLASIIGFSETIVSDPNLPEDMKSEFNHVILNEGKRLAKLINDVLEISVMDEGKITLNKSIIDIVEVVKETVEKNYVSSMKKKITFEFEHPNVEVFVDADREKLGSAFDALINNAIKFTNEDGRVKVIVNNLFKDVEVLISDTGIGIPEKDLPYIFQKFYRVSRPGTEIPGTGIGLVFVKQIVDLHKGLISIQSEIGNGTSFVVKLLKSIKANK